MISIERKIDKMLVKYGFFDDARNPLGSFENDFIDNKDGTVMDRATGLMWQKSGSSKSLENKDANKYLKSLNKERFAGHSDWRMPTIEELASLINKDEINGVHINPLFENKQIRCWTIDQCDPDFANYYRGSWVVNFKNGKISQAIWVDSRSYKPYGGWGSGGTHARNSMNYVKTVRSVK
jgi:hypothetical protein